MTGSAAEYLDVEDLLNLAGALLGEPVPMRDLGRLAAAAERPRASAFGEDAYPSIWEKAAALLQSIVKDHPLVDGNKRLGWLATSVFLEINGVAAGDAVNDDVYDVVIAVAAGRHDVAELAATLRELIGGVD